MHIPVRPRRRPPSWFEQNAAGVCVSTMDGTIVDCNATFASMLRSGREDLIGRNMAHIYAHGFDCEEIAALLRSVGTLNSVEVEMRSVDGRPLWVLQNLVLVGDADAVIHATVVDISDRKRAEEQIEFHAFLRSKDCDEAQGYYFSRPVPAHDITRMLVAS